MKITDLISELQQLAKSAANANVVFEWHEFEGNGTCSSPAALPVTESSYGSQSQIESMRSKVWSTMRRAEPLC